MSEPLTITINRLGAGWADEVASVWTSFTSVADISFFQSWTWVGCRTERRFDRPVFMRADAEGGLVGAVLFNQPRPGGALWMQQSGRPDEDAVFIEHNGPLVCGTAEERAFRLETMLVRAVRWSGVLHLSGVSDALVRAAVQTGAVLDRESSRAAPYADLSGIADQAEFLGKLSRNTRQQLRRAERLYGGIRVTRAGSAAEALEFFAALVTLHTRGWNARGKPGAFASDTVLRFHHSLICRGVPTGEVDLLRIEADTSVAGYLYNFRQGGVVYAYQSGFDYSNVTAQHKPGLTCHAAAIGWYLGENVRIYDFLAGNSQYKRSLASHHRMLHWLVLAHPAHPRAWLTYFRKLRRRVAMALNLHDICQPRQTALVGDR